MKRALIAIVFLLASCSTSKPKSDPKQYLTGCMDGSSYFISTVIKRDLSATEMLGLKQACFQIYRSKLLKKTLDQSY